MNRESLFRFRIAGPCSLQIEGASGTDGGGGGSAPASSSSATSGSGGSPSGASGAPTSSAPVASVPSKSAPASAAPKTSSATGSPAPSSVAPPPPPTPEAAGAADTFNFDEIFNIDSTPVPAEVPVVAAPPQAPAEQQPAPAAAEAPKPQAADPAVPVAQAAPSSGEQRPAPTPGDPAGLAAALVQHKAAAIDHLAESMFQLTQQDVQALEDDVVKHLPKLMARVFVEAQQNFFAQTAKIVPAMLTQHSTQSKTTQEAEEAFYGVWPDLKGDTHKALIARTAAAYRAANPGVPRAQMIEEVGALAMTLAKLPIKPRANGGTQPAAPNAPRVQPSPFQPIGAGVAAASATAPEASEYDILGQQDG